MTSVQKRLDTLGLSKINRLYKVQRERLPSKERERTIERDREGEKT